MDKRIAVGLCGDLWYDENIDMIKKINADKIFGRYILILIMKNGIKKSNMNI